MARLEYAIHYGNNSDLLAQPDVELTTRPTPKIGDIEFQLYGPDTQPPLSVDTGARYAEKEPIGDPTIRQYLGVEPATMTLVGECSPETANRIDDLRYNEFVQLRHARKSGEVQIDNTSTESMGKQYEGIWVQKFTIEMTEIL